MANLTLRFFLNGIDLAKVPVNQNEKGWYYALKTNSNSLYRFTLGDFDLAKKLPSNYARYTNGSHKDYLSENAIDFSSLGNLTANQSVKINGFKYIKGYEVPYGIELVYGNHHFIVVHCKTTWKVGDRVPAGQTICTVMTAEENLASGRYSVINGKKVGFPPHLHMGTITSGSYEKNTLRDFILSPIPKPENQEQNNSTTPVMDEKDKKISELEKSVEVYKQMVNDRNTKITDLEGKYNDEQQLKAKILSDMNEVSKLLSVQYDQSKLWKVEGEEVGQHYTFEGALATMKEEAVSKATTVELLSALIAKITKGKNGKYITRRKDQIGTR